MKKAKVDEQATAENLATNSPAVENPTAAMPATETTTAPTPDDTVTKLNDQLAELTNDLQRTRADFENYRKQVELQRSQAMSAARYATVSKFLPLIDDFERAILTYPEQLAPLQKTLDKTLGELGLARIETAAGTEFNPDFHEAISVEDNDGETEIISETLRPGYFYEGNVLRAAMVKVKHA